MEDSDKNANINSEHHFSLGELMRRHPDMWIGTSVNEDGFITETIISDNDKSSREIEIFSEKALKKK